MLTRTLLILSLLLGVGCDDAPPAEPAAPSPAPEGADGDKPAAAEAAGPLIEDPSFELRATAEGPYRVGELAQLSIRLSSRGEYHVNQDYPLTVGLSGPDEVSFSKSALEKGDAAEFGEKVARFDVPFTPSAAGEHRVEAKIAFAVCTEENCVPDERTLAVTLPVQ